MSYPIVTNISGRSSTGISRPFFCEASDKNSYFVKSQNLSWESLVKEFVVSSLAAEYGLPVAPMTLLEITEELTQQSIVRDAHEFQPGIAIGSMKIPFAEDIRESHLRFVSDEEQARCFCFDWWVRNSDRTLGLLSGDPNILWDPTMGNIHIIDHDRCLDPDFEPEEFLREHAFRDVQNFLEKKTVKKLRTKFESAIYGLGDIWAKIPEGWLTDEEGNERISFTQHDVESMLIKPELEIEGMLAS